MKTCPTCRATFGADYSFCTEHGASLIDSEATWQRYSFPDAPTLVETADVFLSHAPEDAATAADIARHLQTAGVRLALAQAHQPDANRAALAACRVVLVACTDAAMRSGQVKQQMLMAWQMGKPFLPLRVGASRFAAQLDDWLTGRPAVTLGQRPPAHWTADIIHALRLSDLAQPSDHSPQARGLGAAPKSPPADGWDALTIAQQTLVLPRVAANDWTGLRWVAGFTDQVWPTPATSATPDAGHYAPTVRGLGAPQAQVQHEFRLGGRVRLALESERAGYLTLLNEGADGIIYCLCPSAGFAPDDRVTAGRSYLPQSGAYYRAFEISGQSGRERLLAIVTSAPLGLNWHTTDALREPARVLTPADLAVLLQRLRGLDAAQWTARATYFDVVG